MFPEITRDDVFRLETRRLWLRWPDPGDADALAAAASRREVAEMTAGVPHPYPKGEAASRIEDWRARNAGGRALLLALTLKNGDRRAVGTIGVDPLAAAAGLSLGFLLDPAHAGTGLATEAAQAIVDAAFVLTGTANVEASVRVINPAARRVLEKCGFRYEGTVLQDFPARGSLVSCDRFRLDRKTWTSLKQWRMPGFAGCLPAPAPDAGLLASGREE